MIPKTGIVIIAKENNSMKNLVKHGKIWIIAAVVSASSFLYLQIDQSTLDQKQIDLLTEQQYETDDNEEFSVIDTDLIRGFTQFVVDFIRLDL